MWTGGYSEEIGQATGALIVREHLRAENTDEALATLDAMIDAGIAAHWRRIRRPSFYADAVAPATELVDLLVEHRRSHPSTATNTPNLDRAVSEYLAYRNGRDAAD